MSGAISIMGALEKFEATEANLVKLEHLWTEIQKLIPSGVAFGTPPEYEDRVRSYGMLLSALPMIDGWKPTSVPEDLDSIGQNRLDALELGEISAQVSVENWVEEPGRELREYRFRLNHKRRALIRDALVGVIDDIDADIRLLRSKAVKIEAYGQIDRDEWNDLREHVRQVQVLLGNAVEKPPRWGDFMRHISFGYVGDLDDIEQMDWPTVKAALQKGLYGTNEPVPVDVDDLSEIVSAKPKGKVVTKLQWDKLDDEGFERLIFSIISDEKGYENPEWMTQTRAPDRGRDLSVTRILVDPLSGTFRFRVVIQCKHWLSRSVNLTELSIVKDQMLEWNDPRVDVLIIATSGRFTTDAISWAEKHNSIREAPRIELWPDSHLEMLLTTRPALIAEFNLRGS